MANSNYVGYHPNRRVSIFDGNTFLGDAYENPGGLPLPLHHLTLHHRLCLPQYGMRDSRLDIVLWQALVSECAMYPVLDPTSFTFTFDGPQGSKLLLWKETEIVGGIFVEPDEQRLNGKKYLAYAGSLRRGVLVLEIFWTIHPKDGRCYTIQSAERSDVPISKDTLIGDNDLSLSSGVLAWAGLVLGINE